LEKTDLVNDIIPMGSDYVSYNISLVVVVVNDQNFLLGKEVPPDEKETLMIQVEGFSCRGGDWRCTFHWVSTRRMLFFILLVMGKRHRFNSGSGLTWEDWTLTEAVVAEPIRLILAKKRFSGMGV